MLHHVSRNARVALCCDGIGRTGVRPSGSATVTGAATDVHPGHPVHLQDAGDNCHFGVGACEFWTKAINFDFLADEGVINADDLKLFTFVDTAEQAWAEIVRFYDLECS